MARPYFLSVRLSKGELEAYVRVLIKTLDSDIIVRGDLTKADLFRILICTLPRYEGSLEMYSAHLGELKLSEIQSAKATRNNLRSLYQDTKYDKFTDFSKKQ